MLAPVNLTAFTSKDRAKSCVVLLLALGQLFAAQAQTVHSVWENLSFFGWLDQYSLNTATYNYVGPEACVPTSSVNAMTYLQNSASNYFGTALTGITYADWMAADATLVSPSYMDTSPSAGTYYNHIAYALNKYIIVEKGFSLVRFSGMFPTSYWDAAPYDKPSYIYDGHPRANFFLDSLAAGYATIFSILYGGGGGHELLAVGFDWTDANSDGIIQSSENAKLYFVDPLDSSATYSGGYPSGDAKLTYGHIWNAAESTNSNLRIDYNQYGGTLPYESSNYSYTGTATIDTVFAMSVPEPSTLSLVAASGFAVILMRRRRRA